MISHHDLAFSSARVDYGFRVDFVLINCESSFLPFQPFKYPTQLNALTDMGFDKAAARRALEVSAGNMDKAISILTR